ncbi:cysteine rich repeat-containing protein [Bdellovibrio bacteriovorus]|uniref:Uncharacterized protein n=1 Tax=Bdellovibrio bacteriovorus str. Tiberius TaxID=1069642 RepID=K7YNM2_BDEBC|nr:cysteine rich repeat-containing protein [Bdellovibrio bacteriovorus]AFY01401.1 hypothetical protein Bdt_1706 [Bdellovibrio bacteriovorus str. Tiberius]
MGKWIAAVLILCFANVSMAKGPNDVCAKDRETLCGTIQPGEGRVLKCMMENTDKLSADCKAKYEKMKDHAGEMKDACHEDYEKFCANVPAGKGRKIKCMMDRKDELTADCRAQMDNAKDAHKKMRKGK